MNHATESFVARFRGETDPGVLRARLDDALTTPASAVALQAYLEKCGDKTWELAVLLELMDGSHTHKSVTFKSTARALRHAVDLDDVEAAKRILASARRSADAFRGKMKPSSLDRWRNVACSALSWSHLWSLEMWDAIHGGGRGVPQPLQIVHAVSCSDPEPARRMMRNRHLSKVKINFDMYGEAALLPGTPDGHALLREFSPAMAGSRRFFLLHCRAHNLTMVKAAARRKYVDVPVLNEFAKAGHVYVIQLLLDAAGDKFSDKKKTEILACARKQCVVPLPTL